MRTVILLVVILFSCDKEKEQPIQYRIDWTFQIFVDKFFVEAKEHGHKIATPGNLIMRKLPVGYVDENGVMASSRYYQEGKQIIIEIMEISPANCMEVPIYRELSRLVLKKGYVEGDDIMNKYLNPCVYVSYTGSFYLDVRQEYVDRLFAN